MKSICDVVIIGGGPAGLNAALILARSLRSVVVIDHGRPRNRNSRQLHGFLSRDGIDPLELLKIARADLEKYNVPLVNGEAVTAERVNDHFEVLDDNGNMHYARKLLITTGMVDCLPSINGIENFYGTSVFHCPYCDGYEVRDKIIAIYGEGKKGSGFAIKMQEWSRNILLLTDGKVIRGHYREKLKERKIKVYEQPIRELQGKNAILEKVIFADGSSAGCQALFFQTHQYQRSPFAEKLGCDFTSKGVVKTSRSQRSNISGVYVAGDAARDVQLAIIAAAEGAKAAVVIHKDLVREDVLN